jgi:hypothetical protein
VTLSSREERNGLPRPADGDRRHTGVAIEKHLVASTESERTAFHDQPRSGGVEHDG